MGHSGIEKKREEQNQDQLIGKLIIFSYHEFKMCNVYKIKSIKNLLTNKNNNRIREYIKVFILVIAFFAAIFINPLKEPTLKCLHHQTATNRSHQKTLRLWSSRRTGLISGSFLVLRRIITSLQLSWNFSRQSHAAGSVSVFVPTLRSLPLNWLTSQSYKN